MRAGRQVAASEGARNQGRRQAGRQAPAGLPAVCLPADLPTVPRHVRAEKHKQLITRRGVNIKQSVKYLGVPFRHVALEEACALLLAKAQARASYAAQLPLTLPERVTLLLPQ